MEKLDAMVAALGVLVLAVALGGVVTAPPAAGAGSFTIGFVADRATLPAAQANQAGDGTARVPIPVSILNVSRLEFAVTVTLTGAAPTTTVSVAVEGPAGQRGSGAGSGGAQAGLTSSQTVSVPVDVAALPPPATVQAASADAALAAANSTAVNGTGAWTVSVTINSGLPASPAQAGISVATTVISYHAVVQPPVANPR